MNVDRDKKNTVFADGIQDDILTRLASIADLKVISRASVMNYRGTPNTRQIGKALHVSHLLEGSVRRRGNRVRINVQLVDSRTDQQVWAEEYDRTLDDVNAVQSDIAQQVADELHLKLSPHERRAIAHPPSKDLEAYDLYVCGATLLNGSLSPSAHDLDRSIEFLSKAVARDPNFLLAYCELAKAYDLSYHDGERAPERLEKANAAIQSALRLAPDSGEYHLALALHLYWGYADYARAQTELQIASRTLPNDARVPFFTGIIDRRQGRWLEAVRELERATELDPRNESFLGDLGATYWCLRDYKKAGRAYDRAVGLEPNDLHVRLWWASLDLDERADIRPAKAVAENILARDPVAISGEVGVARFWLSLYERDFSAADRLLKTLRDAGTDALPLGENDEGIDAPRAFFEGWVSQLQGDAVAARTYFLAARREEEKNPDPSPDSAPRLCALGAIDAQLGRKEDALREGRRALEVMPLTKDSLKGADVLYCFALVCTWTGERDLALSQLEKLVGIPAGPAYGQLRLDPSWDSLRADPRFEKIVASLAPHAEDISQDFP